MNRREWAGQARARARGHRPACGSHPEALTEVADGALAGGLVDQHADRLHGQCELLRQAGRQEGQVTMSRVDSAGRARGRQWQQGTVRPAQPPLPTSGPHLPGCAPCNPWLLRSMHPAPAVRTARCTCCALLQPVPRPPTWMCSLLRGLVYSTEVWPAPNSITCGRGSSGSSGGKADAQRGGERVGACTAAACTACGRARGLTAGDGGLVWESGEQAGGHGPGCAAWGSKHTRGQQIQVQSGSPASPPAPLQQLHKTV